MREYDIVSREIQLRISTGERVLAIGFSVIVGVFALGLRQAPAGVLLLLPLAVLSLVFYAVHVTNAILTLGGYREYLADAVNSILEDRLLVYESVSEPLVRRNWLILAPLFAAYALAAGVVIVFSLWESRAGGQVLLYVSALVLAGLAVALVPACLRLLSSSRRAYEMANTMRGPHRKDGAV